MFSDCLRGAKGTLQPFDNDVAVSEINIVESEIVDFGCSHSVFVGDQCHSPFPCALGLYYTKHGKDFAGFKELHRSARILGAGR